MRRLLATATVMTMAACTLTTSLDGFTSDDVPPGDDAGNDVFVSIPETGASDAPIDVFVPAPDGGDVNIFPEGSFEPGGTQVCQGTNFHSTTSTITSNPYEGKQACRVCADGPGMDGFSLDVRIPAAPVIVGATYRATAWLRKPQNESPPTGEVNINVRTYVDPPFDKVEIASDSIALGTDWKQVAAELKITKPADGLDIYIAAAAGMNVCFIVDGVTLVRTK